MPAAAHFATLGRTTEVHMLKPGTEAPQCTATLDDGSTFDLAEYRGKKHVVLYFYPKDFTAGCTAQACSFRDNYSLIARHDAVIFGISGDDAASHTTFKDKYELPFRLIADPGRHVHKLYDVAGFVPWMTPRITYVIDKDGIIRSSIRHDFRVKEHVPDVIEALEALEAERV
jgi:peroxiredoxin Q/BCP